MIDYQSALNAAQYQAVSTLQGPVLVIAGAGSGKTRTIVYRLARLMEEGVPAASILLLTFTRKAAQSMLERARLLLRQRDALPSLASRGAYAADLDVASIQGGTFHAYAYSILRLFRPEGYGPNLTVMDSQDSLAALQHCREALDAGKGDRSFPKNSTISSLISKSRNKETPLDVILHRDAHHLLPHAQALGELAQSYALYKREKGLLDYDDLLFAFEETLLTRPEALAHCRERHRYIMVDEYQDTNPVQARIAALVAGLSPAKDEDAAPSGEGGGALHPGAGNIMVVGDDAQSIYAFRGADVRNILRFPELFPGARLIRLEENYRSTQPLLNLSNAVLQNAAEGFAKRLFTLRDGGLKPNIVRPLSDHSQAHFVAARIQKLLYAYPPGEIAVLFRAGFHSYALEMALNKLGVAFRKYGGIRYTEAAHVKDAMSFVRLVQNPLDYTAFTRMAELSKGVGAKTCAKLYRLLREGDKLTLRKAVARYSDLARDLDFIDAERQMQSRPASLLSHVVEHYRPRLESLYPDDYPRRLQSLEQLIQLAGDYTDLDVLVADLSLEDPAREEDVSDAVTLSTIHSAKGLEWAAVLLIDLVEERFPSRHALTRPEDYEEERRLMYVACTRAKEFLELYVPASLYDKSSGCHMPAVPSPFVRELDPALYVEWQESYTGGLVQKDAPRPQSAPHQEHLRSGAPRAVNACPLPEPFPLPGFANPDQADEEPPAEPKAQEPALPPSRCGFCRHRIFGRGKIVQYLPPDKYKVNFPGLGLKVIMAQYLSMEE